MSKIKFFNSFCYNSSFNINRRYSNCIVFVDENKTSYHVSVFRLGNNLPIVFDYVIKKRKIYSSLQPCDFIDSMLRQFFAEYF